MAARRWVLLTAGIRGAIQAIREDRILHEAHPTAGDIRRLADLFGLSINAAERYAATVDHPDLITEDQRPLPRPDHQDRDPRGDHVVDCWIEEVPIAI
ncbi:hypothetical protein [Actinomadura alba]|uniref:hypothetical protein n=1 Tax=Actinomadura alba TaxID=406431 RepID=UPI0031DC2299